MKAIAPIYLAHVGGAMILTLSVIGIVPQAGYGREVDQATLCEKFPLNSACEGYVPVNQLEAEDESNSVMKVQLERSGADDEWVRFEMTDDEAGKMILTAYHTTRAKRGLFSGVANGMTNGMTGLIPFPLPLPFSINFHRWYDHPTLSLTFQPDTCPVSASIKLNPEIDQAPVCKFKGTESITLPAETDLYAGTFTLEYQDEEMIRTVKFRIPLEED
ncbi:MAG: hypothetical protein F6K19_41445 [Cyanothece sp. SIO1E1]|nr:hypothetical protein [Cyanothece sp. SIO1E1]